MSLRMSRYVSRGFRRPALTREDNPVFWDQHQEFLRKIASDRTAQDPANWSPGKQRAILMIERSAIALDCIAHMENSTHGASQEDFAELRKEGYAVRPLGDRYHKLTPAGIRAAKDCAAIVAKKLGLHHISSKTRDARDNGARCTCGWNHSSDERFGRTGPAIALAISRHLADPDAWKIANERSVERIEKLFEGTKDGC